MKGNWVKVRNQGGDVGNQSGNLGTADEVTQNSNGNDKFKEWREAKIIENEHIVKIQFHAFDLMPFLLTLDISHTISL